MSDSSGGQLNATGLFNTLLLILFIGLKLTGFIAWSWWWVLSPLWIPLVLALIAGVVIFFVVTRR